LNQRVARNKNKEKKMFIPIPMPVVRKNGCGQNPGATKMAVFAGVFVSFFGMALFFAIRDDKEHSTNFMFQTIDGREAEVFFNGIPVGVTPLQMSYADVLPHLDILEWTSDWPPEDVGHQSQYVFKDYHFNVAVKSADPPAHDENRLYIQEISKNGNGFFGSLRIKVVDASGRVGIFTGGASETNGKKKKKHEEKLFFYFQ
jgi:hypothetical protein